MSCKSCRDDSAWFRSFIVSARKPDTGKCGCKTPTFPDCPDCAVTSQELSDLVDRGHGKVSDLVYKAACAASVIDYAYSSSLMNEALKVRLLTESARDCQKQACNVVAILKDYLGC
jgi:hypothetical protein